MRDGPFLDLTCASPFYLLRIIDHNVSIGSTSLVHSAILMSTFFRSAFYLESRNTSSDYL